MIINQTEIRTTIGGLFPGLLKKHKLESFLPTHEQVWNNIDQKVIEKRISDYITKNIEEFKTLNVNAYDKKIHKLQDLYGKDANNWWKIDDDPAYRDFNHIDENTLKSIYKLMYECIYKQLNDICNISKLSEAIKLNDDLRIFNKFKNGWTINQKSELLPQNLKATYKNAYYTESFANMFTILALDALMCNTLYMSRFPGTYVCYNINENKIIDKDTYETTASKNLNKSTNIIEFTDDKLITIAFHDNCILNLKYPRYHQIFKDKNLPDEFNYESFVKEKWDWQNESKCYCEIYQIISNIKENTHDIASPCVCLHKRTHILNHKQTQIPKLSCHHEEDHEQTQIPNHEQTHTLKEKCIISSIKASVSNNPKKSIFALFLLIIAVLSLIALRSQENTAPNETDENTEINSEITQLDD